MGSRSRRRTRSRAVKDDLFRIVVAANPGSDVTVLPELELVKAGLLYGDSVVLISPATTMLLGVEAMERFEPRKQVALMSKVAPYLLPEAEVPDFTRGLEELNKFLQARSSTAAERLLKRQLVEKLGPIKAELSRAVRDVSSGSGLDQLAIARSRGLVEIDSVDSGSAVDLLASCVISARLAELGQPREESDPHLSRMVSTFVEKLAGHLASGRNYLIFDAQIAALVDVAIREGVFQPAKGPAGRSAQAMAASELMARLPTFPGAKVDEVLDIRSELSQPLTQFRGAMVNVAKEFTSEPWERDFEDEVQDAWVGSVQPALESIDSAIKDSRSILAVASDTASAAKASLPGLLIVGAAAAGHLGTAADVIGGALSAGAPLLQFLRERQSQAQEIRMQPFYFLYGVGRRLRE